MTPNEAAQLREAAAAFAAMREGMQRIGQAVGETMKRMGPLVDTLMTAAGEQLAAEAEMDLRLQDELDADFRRLELFDQDSP